MHVFGVIVACVEIFVPSRHVPSPMRWPPKMLGLYWRHLHMFGFGTAVALAFRVVVSVIFILWGLRCRLLNGTWDSVGLCWAG